MSLVQVDRRDRSKKNAQWPRDQELRPLYQTGKTDLYMELRVNSLLCCLLFNMFTDHISFQL